MNAPRLLIALVAAIALLATPSVAMADDPPVPAVTEPYILQLFGTDVVLTVDVTDGQLSSVGLISPGDATLSSGNDNQVRFVLGDGTGPTVKVKAKHDKIETKVTGTTLAELVGDHAWQGQLFGDAPATRIEFSIGDSSGMPIFSAGPTVTGTGAADPAITVREYSDDDDDDEFGVKARIELRYTDANSEVLTASVTIKVEVEHDDGEQVAKLKITVRSELIPPAALTEAVINGGTPIALPQCHDDHGDHDDDGHDDHDDHDDDCDDDHDDRHDDEHDDEHHRDGRKGHHDDHDD